jgi:Na+/melibiose symporter-like transporter
VRIRTDDEVYRVDAVWLGPPKATFPWRARYVAWGVGIVVFLFVLLIERRMGIGFGFFSTGWAIVATVLITRVVCSRITHERPLSAVAVMWLRELTAPRSSPETRGGAVSAAKIRVRTDRPRPRAKRVRREATTGAER